MLVAWYYLELALSAVAQLAENVRENFHSRYKGDIWAIKISEFWCSVLWPKDKHFSLCCQTNDDMQRNSGIVVGFLGFDNFETHHLVLFTHYYDDLTKFKQETNHKREISIYRHICVWLVGNGLSSRRSKTSKGVKDPKSVETKAVAARAFAKRKKKRK